MMQYNLVWFFIRIQHLKKFLLLAYGFGSQIISISIQAYHGHWNAVHVPVGIFSLVLNWAFLITQGIF